MKLAHVAIFTGMGILIVIGIFFYQNSSNLNLNTNNYENVVNETSIIDKPDNQSDPIVSAEQNTLPTDVLPIPQDPFPHTIPNQLVFFMTPNSTMKIYVEYSSTLQNSGNISSLITVYNRTLDSYDKIDSGQIKTNVYPDSIPTSKGSNTTVSYEIIAQPRLKGIYWISLTQICDLMPVAIGIDDSHINPSEIPVPWGPRSCPAQELEVRILGVSGGIPEYKIAKPL